MYDGLRDSGIFPTLSKTIRSWNSSDTRTDENACAYFPILHITTCF